MTKIYVLDTSVLISDPVSFKSFNDNEVVLHITVLDELDKLKKQQGDVGRNARVAIRQLDEVSNLGDISTGILLDNDVLFRIDANSYEGIGDALYGDTRIIACAHALYKKKPKREVVLVSNDINMRVRAKALGIEAQSYDKSSSSSSDLYSGIRYIKNEAAGADLITNNVLNPADHKLEFFPNECVVFQDESGNEIAKGRMIGKRVKIIKRIYPWGLAPRSSEQELAIELLIDTKVPLVSLLGRAGCGKSIIALSACLELVLEKRFYNKLVIYRPIQPVGNDIGYTPGSIQEKLAPWFQAIMDNFEVLFSSSNGDKWRANFEAIVRKEKIQLEALTYIRGRSIPNAIILFDEIQNITKEEIKTVLTRVGEKSKVIVTGDIEQIDNHKLDASNNGLAYIIEKFKTSELAGHLTLVKGERSPLATLAAELL